MEKKFETIFHVNEIDKNNNYPYLSPLYTISDYITTYRYRRFHLSPINHFGRLL